MAIDLNTAGDFDTILDSAETAMLKRRGSAATIALAKAWRYSSLTQPAEAGFAGVARNDVVWQFAWADGIDLPRLGDAILDGANECWTILSVEIRGANSRLRCVTRNLRIVHELDDRVEIQAAIWEDSGSGPEITGWTTLRTAVPARIQPAEVTIDHTADPPTSKSTYRIVLADDTPLDHNHRLLGPDGAVYQILAHTQAERFDVLPIATVNKIGE
ncbi:MAG: hypothetical protein AB7G28_20155 [Pirellulales bacterium]